ncbi:MAG: zinc carboxypeptidase [Phycisphaerae bacterium]|nr:zinc carboxypeptidase [Phycisphaerae bacterium]
MRIMPVTSFSIGRLRLLVPVLAVWCLNSSAAMGAERVEPIVAPSPVADSLPMLPDRDVTGPDARLIRISVDVFERQPADLQDWLHDRLDTCAIDRDDDGSRHAVLILSSDEVAALSLRGVPFEDSGSVADHILQFAPWNTLAIKRIPSIEPLLPGPVPPQSGADAVNPRGVPIDCQQIGTSLQPYDVFHNPGESLCFLQNLAAAYPDFVRLVSIGLSVEGRDIWALKITDNPDTVEPDEEVVLFKGVTHAREWATHETMLYLAEYLTSRYATDPQVQHIVDHTVVWLVPIANPDGYWYTWYGPAEQNARMWRKNRTVNAGSSCRGVDINRNYAHNWGYDNSGSSGNRCAETYRGPSAASEPETQAIQNFVAAHKPTISVSYHSYSQLWLFSWGYTSSVTAESFSSMRAIGKKLSELVFGVHGKVYVPGQSSYTIYATNGDYNEYAYARHGSLAFTPEVRPRTSAEGGFLLPEDQILQCAEENLAAALWLLDNAAGAIEVRKADSSPLFDYVPEEGVLSFSLPATPTQQQPENSIGFSTSFNNALFTLLNDALHNPPSFQSYPAHFEACGSGSGYELRVKSNAAARNWINALESYRALPYVFEDGADVMLSNVAPGINLIGIPSSVPVRLADVRVVKRRMQAATADFGATEVILEERSAAEDAANPAPWIGWQWDYVHPDGSIETSQLFGPNPFVLPFRSYRVQVNVPSYQFGSTQPSGAVYYLRFPGSSLDCDRNGVLDALDIDQGTSGDCNGDGIPDVCQTDCNGNGFADECDPLVSDVDYFVGQLLAEEPDPSNLCILDANADTLLNGDDIGPFVFRLIGN